MYTYLNCNTETWSGKSWGFQSYCFGLFHCLVKWYSMSQNVSMFVLGVNSIPVIECNNFNEDCNNCTTLWVKCNFDNVNCSNLLKCFFHFLEIDLTIDIYFHVNVFQLLYQVDSELYDIL